MDQSIENKGIVKEKIEGAIDIGCTMVSRSKKVRKKLSSNTDNISSVKKSMEEMDRMTMELIDRLFEINARIDQSAKRKSRAGVLYQKLLNGVNDLMRSFWKRMETMKLTYQDMFTL